ncbi:sulfonate ABC transporter substrate-binding protein [Bacillaceae bacterium W0354]
MTTLKGVYRKKVTYFFISLMMVASLFLVACGDQDEANESEDQVVRIGYQKNGPFLIVKALGNLDERLKEEGYEVEWKLFQAGPALVEAINTGSIDVGRTGNTPVIFAQASGAPFVYLQAGFSKFLGSGILVHEDSSIESLEDLKGKNIGFARGSSSHYLIVKALEKAGLSIDDVEVSYLQPGDARIAFEQEQIDAWVVWDPYAASAHVDSNARFIVDGEGLTTDRDFFVATEKYYDENKEILDIIVEEIDKSLQWANENTGELVDLLVEELQINEEAIEITVNRREYGIEPLNEDIINEQQEIADLFYELEIIPEKLNVRDVIK